MDLSTLQCLRFIHRYGMIYSDGTRWRASGSAHTLKFETITRLDALGFTRIVFTAMGIHIGRSLTVEGMAAARAEHLMPKMVMA